MKKILLGFVLSAFIISTSIVSFFNMQEVIFYYVIKQSGNLVSNSSIKGIKNNEYLPFYQLNLQASTTQTFDNKDDDPLHKILRKIALCR